MIPSGKIEKTCEHCKTIFVVKRHREHTARFCSRSCMADGLSGSGSPRYKGLHKTCQNCGKAYRTNWVGRRKGRDGNNAVGGGKLFCSLLCYKSSDKAKMDHANALKAAQAVNKSTPIRGRYYKRKGNTNEFKTMDRLEESGYYCMRSSGSHGVWDLVAINHSEIIFIQVKSNSRPGREEMTRMKEFNIGHPHARKELWTWKDYARQPVIEIL